MRARILAGVVGLGLLALQSNAWAIPAFARKYDVTCYACHTSIPRLNQTGYLFKRLGYRMPPDLEEGKAAPKISEIDTGKWSFNNSAALILQSSFTVGKSKEDGVSSDTSNSFNMDHALLFFGGAVPDSPFSYFAEYKLYEDGESGLETGYVQYGGGSATSSYFARAGKMHLQETEGFRASDPLGLLDEGPMMFGAASPNNFSFDQAPVGVEAGYTWASQYYKQVLGLTLRASNGVAADGSTVDGGSERKGKDLWFEGDFIYASDSAVSLLGYVGKKEQIQNEGTGEEFTYEPAVQRLGVFGNYVLMRKLDLMGGFLYGKEDWQATLNDAVGDFKSTDIYGEADYTLAQGFVATGRFEHRSESLDGESGDAKTTVMTAAVQKALTKMGNARVRLAYSHVQFTDPADVKSSEDLAKLDLRFGW